MGYGDVFIGYGLGDYDQEEIENPKWKPIGCSNNKQVRKKMKKKWKKIICPQCKGQGKYEKIVGQFDRTDVVKCEICQGYGKIKTRRKGG